MNPKLGSRVFFSFVKEGDTPLAQVTISTNRAEDLEIEKVGNNTNFISLQLSPLEKGKRYILTAQLRPDASKGIIKDTVKMLEYYGDAIVMRHF